MHRTAVSIILVLYVLQQAHCQNLTTEQIENQNNCKCVLYYLCDDDNNININGEGLLDFRLGNDLKRITCPTESTPQYCCYLPGTTREVTEKPTERSVPTAAPTKSPDTKTPELKTITKNVTCGIQRPSIDVRILNGEFSSTIPGEFPWMAAIYRKNKFKCTGILIHPQVVLTVAHYVMKSFTRDYKVVANGETLLGLQTDSEHERSVIGVIRHPDFYSGGLHNDIALVILEKPLVISQFGALINEICLPGGNDQESFRNNSCIVAGWSNKDTSVPLRKVVVPTVPHDICQEKLRKNSKLGAGFELHDSFTCAGGIKNQDACLGDGGSPLMCPINNVFHLVGMVSWGQGCGQTNVPGVYTDVAKFTSWIKQELDKNLIKHNL
ncbi:unnamed protein product [Brassicogethes aeneus]|uniref:Peptidase S1 domain-containing protein n=1 Tax=Brassicogethes aeneus TaxID=1431903 RepID=A0A9P0BAX7_BRAAE|nr:unnamed protein product [Brassicogethes aeneus]